MENTLRGKVFRSGRSAVALGSGAVLLAGCSFGVRHVCCADPETPPGVLTVCANNTSDEDYPRFQVTTRDGVLCTSLELGAGGGNIPIMGTGP